MRWWRGRSIWIRQLRALQDVRYYGPVSGDHVGPAGRWRAGRIMTGCRVAIPGTRSKLSEVQGGPQISPLRYLTEAGGEMTLRALAYIMRPSASPNDTDRSCSVRNVIPRLENEARLWAPDLLLPVQDARSFLSQLASASRLLGMTRKGRRLDRTWWLDRGFFHHPGRSSGLKSALGSSGRRLLVVRCLTPGLRPF